MKLNLACGMDYREGYVNIDDYSMYAGRMKTDKMDDVKTLKWQDDSVEEILLLHFAMYIHVLEMPALLKRWFGWLQQGGKLVIETGDVKLLAKTILSTDDPKIINGTNGVMQFYGWDTTVGHKWAWCFDTLAPLLAEAGFKDITWKYGGTHQRPERDITITATKI
jgi:hypothetical protein